MTRSSSPPWAIYLLVLVGIIIASHAAAFAAFEIYYRLADRTHRAWWTGYALNYAAPLLAGLTIGTVLVVAIARRNRFQPTLLAHFARTSSWYLFALWIAVVIYRDRDSTDLGLWVQIVLWPLVGTGGAILIDLIATLLDRTRVKGAL